MTTIATHHSPLFTCRVYTDDVRGGCSECDIADTTTPRWLLFHSRWGHLLKHVCVEGGGVGSLTTKSVRPVRVCVNAAWSVPTACPRKPVTHRFVDGVVIGRGAVLRECTLRNFLPRPPVARVRSQPSFVPLSLSLSPSLARVLVSYRHVSSLRVPSPPSRRHR